VILIVSWNEFMENSHIEPSQLYGTQSLDVLRPLIAAWKAGGGGAAPPPPAAGPAAGGTLQAKITGLNVRSGPGTTYAPIGQINPGTPFAVTGQQGSWYAIDYYGQTGWVAGWLVTTDGAAATPAAPTTPPAGGASLQAKITGLNVRSGPGTTYDILGQINPGTSFAITGQQGSWYAIDYFGQTGWVAGWLVTTGGAPTPAPATGGTVQASITGLNVRSGPGTTYGILGQINPGTSFAVTGQQGNWYAIDYFGQAGWVAGWLVSRGP
jgi:N-acetylmuramoyl-L-alanine amidase